MNKKCKRFFYIFQSAGFNQRAGSHKETGEKSKKQKTNSCDMKIFYPYVLCHSIHAWKNVNIYCECFLYP